MFNYEIMYFDFPTVIERYSYANWILNLDETKLTSGYIFILSRGIVSWHSSKRTCITKSTMEYEFVALEKAGTRAEWVRNFLIDV